MSSCQCIKSNNNVKIVEGCGERAQNFECSVTHVCEQQHDLEHPPQDKSLVFGVCQKAGRFATDESGLESFLVAWTTSKFVDISLGWTCWASGMISVSRWKLSTSAFAKGNVSGRMHTVKYQQREDSILLSPGLRKACYKRRSDLLKLGWHWFTNRQSLCLCRPDGPL